MHNQAILCGRVGTAPEIRTFQSGDRLATFSFATWETWKDKQTGEKKKKTEWHNIKVLNQGLVSLIEKAVKKGSTLHITGKIEKSKWTDQSGNERHAIDIVIKGKHGSLSIAHTPQENNSSHINGGYSTGIPAEELNNIPPSYDDDEIPGFNSPS